MFCGGSSNWAEFRIPRILAHKLGAKNLRREPWEQPQRQKAQVTALLNTHAIPSSLNLFAVAGVLGKVLTLKPRFSTPFSWVQPLRQQGIFREEMKKIEQKKKKMSQLLHLRMSIYLQWWQCFKKTGLLIARNLCLRWKHMFFFHC